MTESYFNVIVTAPDGKTEWQGHLQGVPRKGDSLTMRKPNTGDEIFSGYVSEVHWGLVEGRSGAVVSVWLTEDVPGTRKKGDDVEQCSQCGATSGDDWSQCNGFTCPMPMSPYYSGELDPSDEIPF